jgi:hypothetical protein
MTVTASKLLDDFQALSPEEQLLVRERVVSLTENLQRSALERLRGASAGKALLSKLLTDRAGERARG